MNKKIIIGIIILSISFLGVLVLINNSKKEGHQEQSLQNEIQKEETNQPQSKLPAEKIEVIHFHGTQQCWACITVGEYALKTIQEKFPEEYKNQTIIFKDINVELPENKDIVTKYQARGSSLFINTIRGDEENIEEDINVWRLISNENQFISYFEEKLSLLLGKQI